MKVILLCAGYATRLYPLTKDKPKPLLPIAGRPILEWILERVISLPKVEAVTVVTNHRFAAHFETWSKGVRCPWPLEVVDDQTTTNENRLGAIGDLAFVLAQKKIQAEDLLVIAGDNLFDFELGGFLKFAETKRPHPVIALFDVGDRELATRYGLVRTTEDGRVLEFLEKPNPAPTTLASCGIYWLPGESRVSLDRYLSAGHNPDQPGHYMRWLAEQAGLFATSLNGHWLDIGDPVSYEKANTLFREIYSERKKS